MKKIDISILSDINRKIKSLNSNKIKNPIKIKLKA